MLDELEDGLEDEPEELFELFVLDEPDELLLDELDESELVVLSAAACLASSCFLLRSWTSAVEPVVAKSDCGSMMPPGSSHSNPIKAST